MRKIPTVFVRYPQDRRRLLPEVTPGCGWVLAGEGVATRKYDGTCVMCDVDGGWWARREVRPGKVPPPAWVEVELDEVTGRRVGWEPAERSAFAPWLAEVVGPGAVYAPGTYELCGPRVNGNPEGFDRHTLVRHADAARVDLPPLRGGRVEDVFVVLAAILGGLRLEGVVWHHPDGRMAKLKSRDFVGAPRRT